MIYLLVTFSGRRRSAFGYRREEANEEEAEQKAAEVFESDLKKFQDKYAHLNKVDRYVNYNNITKE